MAARSKKNTTKHVVSISVDIGPMLDELAVQVEDALERSMGYVDEELQLPTKVVNQIAKDIAASVAEEDVRKVLVDRAVKVAIQSLRLP